MIVIGIFIRGFHNGGIEKVFENYFTHMDLSSYEIHFITYLKNDPERKKVFLDLGCIVHELSPFRGHKINATNLREYQKLFSEVSFDVVHNNMPDNLLPLYWAKRKNVPCRILHAHSNYCIENHWFDKIKFSFYKYGYLLNASRANVLFASSEEAGLSAFGKKNLGRCQILPNCIEIERFRFQPSVRERLRDQLGLGDALVIGHVGRYESNHKNQEFTLALMRELLAKKRDCRLLMIGGGERLDEFKNAAADLGDRVIFTGPVSNIQDYYQAMDVFVLPSRKEGLGIVLVEAQVNGLFCIASDRVPRESKISDYVKYLSIDHGTEEWVDEILKHYCHDRYVGTDPKRENRFSIEENARILEEIYKGKYC